MYRMPRKTPQFGWLFGPEKLRHVRNSCLYSLRSSWKERLVKHLLLRLGSATQKCCSVEEKINFTEISALVADGDRFSTSILSQILRGFGLSHHVTVATGEEAKKQLATNKYDLLISENFLADMKGADLIRWIRRQPEPTLRYLPIVVLTGYTQFSNVTTARDCGVSSVVRKPVAPNTLFDHIVWSAKTERPFIDADEYAGPCRRFREGDPAPGLNRRVSDHYGEAMLETNMEANKETTEEAAT
jgi:two-component system, chemotaxis family, chemotaxis protein CheY